MTRTVVYDTEIACDKVIVGLLEDGAFSSWTLTGPADLEAMATVRTHLTGARLVGFNNLAFDTYVLDGIFKGRSPQELHAAVKVLIGKGTDAAGRNQHPWQKAEQLGLRPSGFSEIDLLHYCKQASLKVYEARLGFDRIVEIPFDPEHGIGDREEETLAYLEHDCRATAALHAALGEEIAARETLAAMFEIPALVTKMPASAAETVIVAEYGKRTGVEKAELAAMAKRFRDCDIAIEIAPWVQTLAEGTVAAEVIAKITGTTVKYRGGERVAIEPPLPTTVVIGDLTVAFGVGGLHSKDGPGRADSTDVEVVTDYDVSSYYPALLLAPGGAPRDLDADAFTAIYRGLLDRRLAAKAAGRKREADALKLTLNSTFGKTGAPWSPLFSPISFLRTTLNGQLALIALIDRLQREGGATVCSANTDGVLVRYRRDEAAKVAAVIESWQAATGFTLEGVEVATIRRRDVNSYIAVLASGDVKSKGALAVAPGLDLNPTETIVAQAVACAMRGGDAEGHIRAAAARRELALFVSVATTNGGGFRIGETPLGRVIRTYRTTDASPPEIIDSAKGRVGDRRKAIGCKTIERLSDWPDDLDVDAYVAATRDLLDMTEVAIDPAAPAPKRKKAAPGKRPAKAKAKAAGEEMGEGVDIIQPLPTTGGAVQCTGAHPEARTLDAVDNGRLPIRPVWGSGRRGLRGRLQGRPGGWQLGRRAGLGVWPPPSRPGGEQLLLRLPVRPRPGRRRAADAGPLARAPCRHGRRRRDQGAAPDRARLRGADGDHRDLAREFTVDIRARRAGDRSLPCRDPDRQDHRPQDSDRRSRRRRPQPSRAAAGRRQRQARLCQGRQGAEGESPRVRAGAPVRRRRDRRVDGLGAAAGRSIRRIWRVRRGSADRRGVGEPGRGGVAGKRPSGQ